MVSEGENTVIPEDPLIHVFSKLTIDAPFFSELSKYADNQEIYAKYYQNSNILILWNAIDVIERMDTNPKTGEDHLAFCNMIRWMLAKYGTDPVWHCYIGWIMNFFRSHEVASHYYPLRMADHFIPGKWFTRETDVKAIYEQALAESKEELKEAKKVANDAVAAGPTTEGTGDEKGINMDEFKIGDEDNG